MNNEEQNLLLKYPSLEVLYEYIKDTLSRESQKLSALSSKATFLWGAITTILGIIIPIAHQVGKIGLDSPIVYGILALYGVITTLSWIIIFPQPFNDIADFDNLWDDFSERTREVFWYDMFIYTARASKENERRLLLNAWLIRIISIATLIQFAFVLGWLWTSVI